MDIFFCNSEYCLLDFTNDDIYKMEMPKRRKSLALNCYRLFILSSSSCLDLLWVVFSSFFHKISCHKTNSMYFWWQKEIKGRNWFLIWNNRKFSSLRSIFLRIELHQTINIFISHKKGNFDQDSCYESIDPPYFSLFWYNWLTKSYRS